MAQKTNKSESAPQPKPASAKKNAPVKKAAAPAKEPAPKKPVPAKAAPAKKAAPEKAVQQLPPIHTLRVECVSGPWLDEKCVRFIDVPATVSLYDLHIAILDSVEFDEDFPFHFFMAIAPEAAHQLLPEYAEDISPDEIDPDVYEEMPVFDYATQAGAKNCLFYAFGSDYDDWVFKVLYIEQAVADPDEFYPLVLESRSEGPNPEQYGSGFDDFAESRSEFTPSMRGSGSGDDLSDDEDDGDELSFFGGRDDDDEDGEDDFFNDDDDSDDLDMGDDEDDW